MGGGGLIGGVAGWFEGSVRVIGVEPEDAPGMATALKVGRLVDVEVDSLGARRVGMIAFSVVKRYVDHVILVRDEDIRAAQRVLWDDLRVVAEPGGATAIAALIGGGYKPTAGERVGVVVCGGNADPGQFV